MIIQNEIISDYNSLLLRFDVKNVISEMERVTHPPEDEDDKKKKKDDDEANPEEMAEIKAIGEEIDAWKASAEGENTEEIPERFIARLFAVKVKYAFEK